MPETPKTQTSTLQALDAFEKAVIAFEAEEFLTELDLNASEQRVRQLQNQARPTNPAAFRIVSERFQYALQQKRKVFKSSTLASNIDILRDVKHLLNEEVERTLNSHEELQQQSSNLQKIGFSADRIRALSQQGTGLTEDVKRIEARDRMIVWGLFLVFAVSSFWIVGKRLGRILRWVGGIFRLGK